MLSGLSVVFIFVTSNAFAEDEDRKVHLNIAHSMNQLITYDHCLYNSKIKDEKIVVLTNIIEEEEAKVKNLFNQNSICGDNFTIKEEQANMWKEEHGKVSEELKKAKEWPWYKFDFKSMGFAITGEAIVTADKITVDVQLPVAAMLFKGRVEKAIDKSMNKALE